MEDNKEVANVTTNDLVQLIRDQGLLIHKLNKEIQQLKSQIHGLNAMKKEQVCYLKKQ